MTAQELFKQFMAQRSDRTFTEAELYDWLLEQDLPDPTGVAGTRAAILRDECLTLPDVTYVTMTATSYLYAYDGEDWAPEIPPRMYVDEWSITLLLIVAVAVLAGVML